MRRSRLAALRADVFDTWCVTRDNRGRGIWFLPTPLSNLQPSANWAGSARSEASGARLIVPAGVRARLLITCQVPACHLIRRQIGSLAARVSRAGGVKGLVPALRLTKQNASIQGAEKRVCARGMRGRGA